MKFWCNHIWKTKEIVKLRYEGLYIFFAEYQYCIKCNKERVKEWSCPVEWYQEMERRKNGTA